MSKISVGALFGAILAFAGLNFGFGGFVLVAVLMALGAALGYLLEATGFDVSEMFGSARKSSSSR